MGTSTTICGRSKGESKGDSANAKWHAMLQQLLKYKEKHGDTLVPNRYSECPQLGSWVSTQRRQYKAMIEKQRRVEANESIDDMEIVKGSPMSPERAKILDEIGFVWSTSDPRHVPWETRFSQLLEFKRLYGHCLVPIKFAENPQLSNWVSAQRQELKLIKGGKSSSRLTEDKIRKLNDIGFIWEAQRGGPRRKHESVSSQKASLASPKNQSSSHGNDDPNGCISSSPSFDMSSVVSGEQKQNFDSIETGERQDKALPLKKRRKLESKTKSFYDKPTEEKIAAESRASLPPLPKRAVSPPTPNAAENLKLFLEQDLSARGSQGMAKEMILMKQRVPDRDVGIPYEGPSDPLQSLPKIDPSALVRLCGVGQNGPHAVRGAPMRDQTHLSNLLKSALTSSSLFLPPPSAPQMDMQTSDLPLPPWLLMQLQMEVIAGQERRRVQEEILRQHDVARELSFLAALAVISKAPLNQYQ